MGERYTPAPMSEVKPKQDPFKLRKEAFRKAKGLEENAPIDETEYIHWGMMEQPFKPYVYEPAKLSSVKRQEPQPDQQLDDVRSQLEILQGGHDTTQTLPTNVTPLDPPSSPLKQQKEA